MHPSHTYSLPLPILIIFLLIQLCPFLQAQPCPNNQIGGLVLTSQAQIDALDCSEVQGTLIINREASLADSITDLSNLSQLSVIHGSLRIYGTGYLHALTGLDSLMIEGESIEIIENEQLESLAGLQECVFLGKEVIVNHNPMLSSFGASISMDTTINSLRIINNPSLHTIDGFEHISSIQGQGLVIMDNQSLTKVGPFSSLKEVGYSHGGEFEQGFLSLINNPLLEQLDAFPQLKRTGVLSLIGHTSLKHLDGLQTLTDVEGMVITNNDSIKTIDGFNTLHLGSYLGPASACAISDYDNKSLQISGNASLESITGFQQETATGIIYIGNNPQLTSITGFTQLTSPSGLCLHHNPQLKDLSGLANVESVDNWIHLEDIGITDVSDLEKLQTASWFDIIDNDDLVHLSGLANLTNLSILKIQGNQSLVSIDSTFLFNSRNPSIVRIDENPSLKEINGFCSIDSLKRLSITHNPVLTTIKGLGNLQKVTTNLLLAGNPMARECCGLYRLVSEGHRASVHQFHVDNSGCLASDILAKDSCPKVDISPSDTLIVPNTSIGLIYPNPASDEATFVTQRTETTAFTAVMFDVRGKQVMPVQEQSLEDGIHEIKLDTQTLPSGIYYYHVQLGDLRETLKLLIRH